MRLLLNLWVNTEIQSEERVNTEIMRLLLNLLLLHQSEEWVNTKIQSEERVNTEIMRLLLNLLLLHQSEEWVNTKIQSEEKVVRLTRLNLSLIIYQISGYTLTETSRVLLITSLPMLNIPNILTLLRR